MFSVYIKQHKNNSACNISSVAFPDIQTAWIERLTMCKLKHIVVFTYNAVWHMAHNSIYKVMTGFLRVCPVADGKFHHHISNFAFCEKVFG